MENKQIIPQIKVTKIKIGDYEFDPPPGLSDLLNSAGVWRVKPKDRKAFDGYSVRDEMRNGRFFTTITKIEGHDNRGKKG